MPKLKTNRAAAKRFRKTANGFKSYSSGRRHNPRPQVPQGEAQASLRWFVADRQE